MDHEDLQYSARKRYISGNLFQYYRRKGCSVMVSEVAQLRQRIAEEYQAAKWGLSGLACGTAQHIFITARMENMSRCHEQLSILVGSEQEATRLVAETLEQC
jgi:hypothetical protein